MFGTSRRHFMRVAGAGLGLGVALRGPIGETDSAEVAQDRGEAPPNDRTVSWSSTPAIAYLSA